VGQELRRRETLVSDLLAALIVTIMLIPQSLAYALLAGLPPEAGLYASHRCRSAALCPLRHQPRAGRGPGRGDLADDRDRHRRARRGGLAGNTGHRRDRCWPCCPA
jgi:hypothetical protein